MTKKNLNKLGSTALIAIIMVLLVSLLSVLELFQIIELKTRDARFRIRGINDVSDSGIVIVGVDDRSYDELPGRMPFPRGYYAKLIKNLNRAGAKLIVFDLQFDKPAPGDNMLAQAISEAGNVILCGKILEERNPRIKSPIKYAYPPNELLLETGVEWGLVNEATDPDGFTRRYILYQPLGKKTYLPIGLKVIESLRGFSDSSKVYVDKDLFHYGNLSIPRVDANTMLINFCGPPKTFPTFSLSDVLDDSDFELRKDDTDYMESFYGEDNLPAEFSELLQNPFKGKIVLIGATIEELKDTFLSPFYSYNGLKEKTPGVEYHANALWTIMHHAYLGKQKVYEVWLTMLLMALLTGLAVYYLKPLGGLIALIIELIVFSIAAILIFNKLDFLIEITGPSLTAIMTFLGTGGIQFLSEQQEKRMIKGMFQHYLSEELVNELIANPDKLKLGGDKKELTVFFSDIEGFTSISENMPPDKLLEYLNKYFTAMTDIILENSGMLDKYIGDAIVAVWGAPIIREDHALLACRAALKMQKRLREMHNIWSREGKPTFKVRIGIGTGIMTIGNIGSAHRLSYTVVGDVVNFASRLESINKQYRTDILISEHTYRKVKEQFYTREIDRITVVGKTEPSRVFSLLGEIGEHVPDELIQSSKLYVTGMELYRRRQWDEAIESFEKALKMDPDDYPSQIFIERCRYFSQNPPPVDWNGVWEFDVK